MSRSYIVAAIAAVSFVLCANYLMAIAGAPQQQWFYCHVLELCKEPTR
jgi:hypothetical protein